MRNISLIFRLLVLLSALVLTGLAVSAYATKPGNTGNQSVASIGISLKVPTTIRARKISVSPHETTNSVVNSEKYVCLDLDKHQRVSLYVLTDNANGSKMMPVSHWLSADQQTGQHRDQPKNCVSIPRHLPAPYHSKNGPITLIISPE